MGIPRLITTDQESEFNNKLNSELMKKIEDKTYFNNTLPSPEKDAGLLLDQYNKAKDYPISEAREEHQKVLEAAKNNITKAQLKQELHYDKRHFKPGSFSVGAKVLVRDFNRKKRKGGKLDYKWRGPYIITKSLGRGLYSLQAEDNSNEISRINGAHLKQYLSPIYSGPADTTTQEDSHIPFKDFDCNLRSQSQSIQHASYDSICSGNLLQERSDGVTKEDSHTPFKDCDSNQRSQSQSISQHAANDYICSGNLLQQGSDSVTKEDSKTPFKDCDSNQSSQSQSISQQVGNDSICSGNLLQEGSDSVTKEDGSIQCQSVTQSAANDHDPFIIHSTTTLLQGDVAFLNNLSVSLDSLESCFCDKNRPEDQPVDVSTPNKAGGFFPTFFGDGHPLSPIVHLPDMYPKAHVRVAQTTPKGQSTKASDDKGKNFVALILDSPRGTDKCKRKLQFSEDDDVTKQQKPRKKKRRLLKNENVQRVAKVKTD
ncbi:uncharacterized protein [Dysidea avara]|uniref:uncharacterized protein n=1 Tax=Dysidea avara TaxID=196820 RepID=UPI00331F25B4